MGSQCQAQPYPLLEFIDCADIPLGLELQMLRGFNLAFMEIFCSCDLLLGSSKVPYGPGASLVRDGMAAAAEGTLGSGAGVARV